MKSYIQLISICIMPGALMQMMSKSDSIDFDKFFKNNVFIFFVKFFSRFFIRGITPGLKCSDSEIDNFIK